MPTQLAHSPEWVSDRYKCPCFKDKQSSVSCSAIDERLASGAGAIGNRRAGESYKVHLPLCHVVLVRFDAKVFAMSQFTDDPTDTRRMAELKESGGSVSAWLSSDENYSAVIRALVDFYSFLPEYKESIEAMSNRRFKIACNGGSHIPSDDSYLKLAIVQYGLETVALANSYTMITSKKCFSCWDATRISMSGAFVPRL